MVKHALGYKASWSLVFQLKVQGSENLLENEQKPKSSKFLVKNMSICIFAIRKFNLTHFKTPCIFDSRQHNDRIYQLYKTRVQYIQKSQA